MIDAIVVIDDALPDPQHYRAEALRLEFKTYEFPHCKFHGIALGAPETTGLLERIHKFDPTLNCCGLTFFRKSPAGQIEPHFIHTDIDMGDWSAILYLNPEPTEGDGTCFWTHLATGLTGSPIPHERSIEGRDVRNWVMRERVDAKFNRLLMFPSTFFHSRAIHDNWGEGDEARLIQVAFGKGGA